jgi:hypothetical protein
MVINGSVEGLNHAAGELSLQFDQRDSRLPKAGRVGICHQPLDNEPIK